MLTEEKAMEALKQVYDPELNINIVDLGLVYEIKIEDGNINVRMTLTAPGCPLTHAITANVQSVLLDFEGVENVDVDIVFTPPWNPSMMSEEAKRRMGFPY